jgi:hypothetical protein
MKLVAMVVISGMLAAAALRCSAETACTEATVEPSVEVAPGKLSLADLLAPGACAPLRQQAEQVSLGAAPRSGSVRVLDGAEIRELLNNLAGGSLGAKEIAGAQISPRIQIPARVQIPVRIVVRRAGAAKSCAEIARFVASAAPALGLASDPNWQTKMECAALPAIAEDTGLELAKSSWNAALRRWEFALHCTHPEDCVPFLVWAREQETGRLAKADHAAASLQHSGASAGSGLRLVKPGQTATLTWDEAGIRVVLPVTCLEAGGLGEFVRVRLKNAPRILRAEVMGDGTLRAAL